MSATSGALIPRYSFGDELASSVIHGVGIVLSIAGLAMLVAFAALHGNALTVVACAVRSAAVSATFVTRRAAVSAFVVSTVPK